MVEVKIHIVVVTIEIVTTAILVCWGYINKTFTEKKDLLEQQKICSSNKSELLI